MLNIAIRTALLAALVLGLAACGGDEEAELPPRLVPVKTELVNAGRLSVRTFPGRVEASRRAELSFRVPGKLIRIAVAEGEPVARGDVIAELDRTDYELALENAEAEHEKASTTFKRSSSLVEKGHISRRQYDRDDRAFKQTAAALRQAQLNLSYTSLKAPFDGVLARRKVENFEEVLAKQEIFSLRDLSLLEISIDVPESVVRLAERSEEAELHLTASFPLAGDEAYPLRVQEVATRADPKTQTFEVKLTLPSPEGINLLSGMTALVHIDLRNVDNFEQVYRLPASALDDTGELPRVWIFDSELETVVPRVVQLAPSNSGALRVRAGLSEGDRVVVAGVSSLEEGMSVYELPQLEQAEY